MITAQLALTFKIQQHDDGRVHIEYALEGMTASIGMMNYANLLFSASQAIAAGKVDMEGEGEGATIIIEPFPLKCLAEIDPQEGEGPHDTLPVEQRHG
jgi:hypothetical protein